MSRILFDVTHPAHVHLFRHAIRDLVDAGHRVAVTSREKEVTTELLDAYGIAHTSLSRKRTRTAALIGEWLVRDARALRHAHRFDPDVVVSRLSPTAVHAARHVGAASVLFHDHEETNRLARILTRFSDIICTPDTFEADFGTSHRRHPGLQELAYLHPDRFSPDRELLSKHGVDPDEPYTVLRFVSMGAHHDVGLSGLSPASKRRLVDELADEGPVYVSTEGPLPDGLDADPIPVPVHTIHDLLAEASLMVTDSNTMATEAGLLGTPTVRSGSYAETDAFTNFAVLEEAGLVESLADETATVERALALAADPDAGDRWERRRAVYLEDKPDLTDYVVDLVTGVAATMGGGPIESPSGETERAVDDGRPADEEHRETPPPAEG